MVGGSSAIRLAKARSSRADRGGWSSVEPGDQTLGSSSRASGFPRASARTPARSREERAEADEVQDLLTGLVGEAGELEAVEAGVEEQTSVPEAGSADHRHASGLGPTSHVGEDLVGLRIEPLDVVGDHDPGMAGPLQQSQGGFGDQEDAGLGPGLESEGGHQREPERLVQAGDVVEHAGSGAVGVPRTAAATLPRRRRR